MLDFKYDIVGSFLRPKDLVTARRAFFNNEIDREELTSVENDAIAELVEKQVLHGLQFVTDGEFRRRWWHLDWLHTFDGFETVHLEKEINGAKHNIEYGKVSGKFFYDKDKSHPEIEAWDFLLDVSKKYPSVTPKKNISGPNMILIDHLLQLGIKDTPYYGEDLDLLIEDIGQAYRDVIQDLYAHGCRYLQIDDTSWTYLVDDKFLAKVNNLGYTQAEVLSWFEKVTSLALTNRPKDMVITNHFCKGNFKGKPLFNGFYDDVAPIIASLDFDGFFIEYDDERSGSFDPWSILKDSGKTFVAGLISTKTDVIEDKEKINNRLAEAKTIIGDNIAISPQCGFASVEEGNSIDEETQWRKIDLLVSCQDLV